MHTVPEAFVRFIAFRLWQLNGAQQNDPETVIYWLVAESRCIDRRDLWDRPHEWHTIFQTEAV